MGAHMNKLSVLLAVSAAVLHGVAYLLYNLRAHRRQSQPNLVSWFIWSFCAFLNAVTFMEMNQSWLSALQFFTGSAASIVTFFFIYKRSERRWPAWHEWLAIGVALSAAYLWIQWHQSTQANLLLVFAVGVGFVPTIRGVWRDPCRETAFPWYLWTVAFLLTGVNALFFTDNPWALVMPVVGAIAHGTVGILAWDRRVHHPVAV